MRESSGWQIDDVASRLRTSKNVILSFEKGTKQPTLRQLQILAVAFQRPLATFFLAEPQKEKPLPHDFRQLPNKKDLFDKKTILAIRKARRFQAISNELAKNLDEPLSPAVEQTFTLEQSPISLARDFRAKFSLTPQKQKAFQSAYQFLNYLRNQIEVLNILTFQFPFPVNDARGFVLTDELPAVIVLNSKDHIKARLFTLMHEFGHILLGETVIDLPDWQSKSDVKQEQWCNAFASSFLLPEALAKEISIEMENQFTNSKLLTRVSNKYKLSKAMLLYNFYKLGYLSKKLYNQILERWDASLVPQPSGGFASADQKCLASLGVKFVSMVSESFEKKHISYSDALSYLSIKSRNFDKVLAKASR
ncbi:MAG: ImmA/IrrE family metallo-endopeptidase [Candidatus Heimdallarchaeota archaeon]